VSLESGVDRGRHAEAAAGVIVKKPDGAWAVMLFA
jgi:hypothetical protein